jgi:predicted nucleic acid binding AN1-type Zn finger protein
VVRSSDPRLRPKHEQQQPAVGAGAGAPIELDATDLAGNPGKHCACCHALDFLPVRCGGCSGSFCASCSPPSAHECPTAKQKQQPHDRIIPECPLCKAVLPILSGQDPNRVVELHIRGGCKPPSTVAAFSHRCSHPKCKVMTPVAITCRSCNSNFCIKHRAPLKHACGEQKQQHQQQRRPLLQQAGAKAAFVSAGPEGRSRAGSQAAAAAVARMQARAAPAAAGPATAPRPAAASATFDPIAQLVAMMGGAGSCDRAAAAAALRLCGGDVQAAAMQLIDDRAARERAGAAAAEGMGAARLLRAPAS